MLLKKSFSQTEPEKNLTPPQIWSVRKSSKNTFIFEKKTDKVQSTINDNIKEELYWKLISCEGVGCSVFSTKLNQQILV